jgi:hypothetical protein
MLRSLFPRGFPWEIVLIVLFALVLALVISAIRRRNDFARLAPNPDVDLPRLETGGRVRGTIRRVFRDPAQGVWLIVLEVARTRYTFCAVDFEQAASRYRSLLGKTADIALFALATLEAGGVDTIRHQIRDADKRELSPDQVLLVPAGGHANDHFTVARVHDTREDAWDEVPLTVYRAEVVRRPDLTLFLDLAVPRAEVPFARHALVHGSARLFGTLDESSQG